MEAEKGSMADNDLQETFEKALDELYRIYHYRTALMGLVSPKGGEIEGGEGLDRHLLAGLLILEARLLLLFLLLLLQVFLELGPLQPHASFDLGKK